ncbi:DUF1329 domain-containing protein [Aromatoleum aromaticum]|uniref:DUF1329 domain-containing protein n=1 Tax=Aromatoleum aromaticum TaxID=551760 RepID=UPI001459BCD4|nr:DUF1329 domain-containing protein [Aromatoleum aromaticum]NMG55991.1 DUF1329 domain-containing protein [Aromatoleum aromaticum]
MKHAFIPCTRILASALFLSVLAPSSVAQTTAADVDKLGKELTPVGAERAANKDGSIPAWNGGIVKPLADFDPNKGYANPFASEKPLVTITAANMEQYKDKLAPGQMELLKRYPSFQMKIYPSQRTAALPQNIYDVVKAEAPKIKLAEGGNGILNMERSTVPFPVPKTGLEVQWNHQARYFGGVWTRYSAEFPVQTNGSFTPVTRVETFAAPWALDKIEPNRLYYYFARLTGPSNVAGDAMLVHEPLDQVNEPRMAWLYNPGTRRVLRAPEFAYDSPGQGADGLRTIDDNLGFNGAPDRYEWKLVGKKEMYISYNNFKLSDRSLKYKDMVQSNHLNPELVRYELHRVWVVEATLKPDVRHIYAKRVFYIDEDSWSVAHIDQYDGRGELWRVREAHLMSFYDQPMTWAIADVLYDLQARRYLVSGMTNEEKPMVFGEKLTLNTFSTSALRRQGN